MSAGALTSVSRLLLARFEVVGKLPRSVLVIAIETAYFQCSRAIVRSALWGASRHVEREPLPSPGAILAALTQASIDGAAYDRDLPGRLKTSLY